jgi:hypothetical protein
LAKININDVNALLTLTLRSYYQDYPDSSLENICKDVSCKFKFNDNVINEKNLFSGCKKWIDFLLHGTFNLKFNIFKSFLLKAVKDKYLLNFLIDIKKRLNIFYGVIVYNDELCQQVDKFIILIDRFIKDTENLMVSDVKSKDQNKLPVSPFNEIENITWNQVTIRITSDNYIHFIAKDTDKKFKYSEFDIFVNKNTKKPSIVWERLKYLPEVSDRRNKKNWDVWRQSCSLIRKYLMNFLKINDDPFENVKIIGYYKPKFILKVDSDYNEYTIEKDIKDLIEKETEHRITGSRKK